MNANASKERISTARIINCVNELFFSNLFVFRSATFRKYITPFNALRSQISRRIWWCVCVCVCVAGTGITNNVTQWLLKQNDSHRMREPWASGGRRQRTPPYFAIVLGIFPQVYFVKLKKNVQHDVLNVIPKASELAVIAICHHIDRNNFRQNEPESVAAPCIPAASTQFLPCSRTHSALTYSESEPSTISSSIVYSLYIWSDLTTYLPRFISACMCSPLLTT